MRRICLVFLLLPLMHLPVLAQSFQERTGDELVSRLNYYDAVSHYRKAYHKNRDLDVLSKIAYCYWETKQYDSAFACYTRLIKSGAKDSTTLIRYARCQIAQGKYVAAKTSLKEYLRTRPMDKETKSWLQSCDEEKQLADNTASIAITNVAFNTRYDEFCPFPQAEALLYCASASPHLLKGEYRFDGKPFLDLFTVKKDVADRFKQPEKLPGDINTALHEGPAVVTPEHQLYFTRSTLDQHDEKGDRYNLKLYSASWIDNAWGNVQPFPYNEKKSSVGHPAVSPDGIWLVVVSDKPGGMGGTDLYVCRKEGKTWSKPINAGEEINTFGREMFPYFANDSTLYFSSDGLPGLGELDLFRVAWKEGPRGKVQNLGKPFNSSRDDFGLAFLKHPSEGYFSSNRPGGKGGDDIYHFKKIVVNLTINVLDSLTKAPIEQAQIRVADSLQPSLDLYTDRDGYGNLNLLGNKQYTFVISKDSLLTQYRTFSTVGVKQDQATTLTVLLSPGYSYKLAGVVKDRESQQPLAGVVTKLKDVQNNTVIATATNQAGEYQFELDKNRSYELDVKEEDHFVAKKAIQTHRGNPATPIKANTLLTPIILNKPIEIENIYYDLDKYDLRPASVIVLDTIRHLMDENSSVILEISSHTDARGTKEYNVDLAAKRAKEAIKYLISKGIDGHRLTYKVYGEEKLAVPCPDNTPCPEELQQKNRRTEFRVIDY